MWTVVVDGNEYSIQDHNDSEQGRLSADGGISTQDVKDVMRSRAADLKQETVAAAKNQDVEKAITNMTEWATIIEEMAGNQIQLPQADETDNLPAN